MQPPISPSFLPISPGSLFLPPFSFRYGGQDGASLLVQWRREEEIQDMPGGEIHRITFTDPGSGLKVKTEARLYAQHDAVDWVIRFQNSGNADTPLLEAVQPLDWTGATGNSESELHFALGSEVSQNDFENRTWAVAPGCHHRLSSMNGRSSRNHLPFFNLQVGDRGFIAAIGWTGNWATQISREWSGDIRVAAGMPITRFVLHPHEEVRTPSILLMNWRGERVTAHNAWRRLMLSHIVPQENGQPIVVPSFYCVWGTNTTEWHLATVERLRKAEIPVEAYWIDAGWYGHEPHVENPNVFTTAWWRNRGNWWPSKEHYPDGFRPLADSLKDKGLEFLLWYETEFADEGGDLFVQHPDWYLSRPGWTSGFLNLGNPEARRGITDFISESIKDHGFTWYRQDFNMDPETHWRLTDTPNRIGITEMKFVEGLYLFWDELLTRHPGLRIDNCSSGGRRIDLETSRRSVPLWRSDYQCNPSFDPVGSQNHTAGLAPWVPLSGGVVGEASSYGLRSCYSAGLIIESGMCTPKNLSDAWLKLAIEEFHEVRPFIYGDYYPIRAFDYFDACWIMLQYDRPDWNAGVAIVLRRRHSYLPEEEIKLSAIDTDAEYSVEIRYELGKADAVTMKGGELAKLKIVLPNCPDSAVIFYRKLGS